ncbi:MAG: HxlR family transcriptional regulator [Flavobacteriales bacterium]|nr:HxlR family transcriptional regulator [Candidatus Arcticimaribacter sp.]|tara:strand:- start:10336 stop:10782 length:447 start_codon:yes stop_codon:yes gene_type:complete
MKHRSGCPISNLVDIVGDKWSLIIIRDFFLERNTFKQFIDSPEKIATNILTDRLKTLMSNGLIDYTYTPNNKKTKYYYLTDMGIDLYPVIYEMAMWSRRNLEVEFNDIATDWFNENQGLDDDQVIKKDVKEYKIIRQDLFDLAKVDSN